MANILVLEDDESVNRGITFSLKKSGNTVFSCETISEAKQLIKKHPIDLAVCDINLPDGNGLDFIMWLRQEFQTYVICLTALDQEIDQVMGYEAGADDYITKPFSLSVLMLKIDAYLKRKMINKKQNKIISGNIHIHLDEMKASLNGEEILLTKTEWKLLILFLKHPKQVLSKNQILENIFDVNGEFVNDNTVAVNIRRLREKIEDDPAKPIYLKNIRGLGYIWNQEVENI